MLSQNDKDKIDRLLKKRNYLLYNKTIVLKKIKLIEDINNKVVLLDDWYVQDVMTNREMLFELDLLGFVESG